MSPSNQTKVSLTTTAGTALQDGGTYGSDTKNGKFHGDITVSVNGHFPDKRHAKGTFSATVKVTNKSTGQQIDSCAVSTKWSATKPKKKK